MVLDISYADDGAFPFVAAVAIDLSPMVAAGMSIISDVFASHALKLNFDATKTEAVLIFRGSESVACDREIYNAEHPVISFQSKAYGQRDLICNRHYLHLGTRFNPKVGPYCDICEKVAITNSASAGFKSKVFIKTSLRDTNGLLAVSMLNGKLLWNSQLWYPMNVRSRLKVHHCYTNYMRASLRIKHRDHVKDEEVFSKYELPYVSMLLFTRRVRFLVRLILHAPMPLLCALAIEHNCALEGQSFIYFLTQDLCHIFKCTDKVKELGSPLDHPLKWFDFIKAWPSQFLPVSYTHLTLPTTPYV